MPFFCVSLAKSNNKIVDIISQKLDKLKSELAACGGVAVAFSGGTDSSFLLAVASEILGENTLAVTAVSCTIPEHELHEAQFFCQDRGIRHVLLRIENSQLPWLRDNPPDRCYLCKKTILKEIINTAAEHGLSIIVEGSNTDDDGDYRPGMRAVRELGVKSPLRSAGLSKSDIRCLSRELGLPTWNKPSLACLASRFPYGESLTPDKLRSVEHAERFLLRLGMKQVRVRIHGNLARLEIVPEDFPLLLSHRLDIYSRLQEYGFAYVTLDLRGYRTGSMNEILPNKSADL